MKPENTVLERLRHHTATLDLNRSGYWKGETLLIEAALEIERLQKEIADMEKAFLLSKTHD